eukprot:6761938-Prymnesium_polylepis.1
MRADALSRLRLKCLRRTQIPLNRSYGNRKVRVRMMPRQRARRAAPRCVGGFRFDSAFRGPRCISISVRFSRVEHVELKASGSAQW